MVGTVARKQVYQVVIYATRESSEEMPRKAERVASIKVKSWGLSVYLYLSGLKERRNAVSAVPAIEVLADV